MAGQGATRQEGDRRARTRRAARERTPLEKYQYALGRLRKLGGDCAWVSDQLARALSPDSAVLLVRQAFGLDCGPRPVILMPDRTAAELQADLERQQFEDGSSPVTARLIRALDARRPGPSPFPDDEVIAEILEQHDLRQRTCAAIRRVIARGGGDARRQKADYERIRPKVRRLLKESGESSTLPAPKHPTLPLRKAKGGDDVLDGVETGSPVRQRRGVVAT